MARQPLGTRAELAYLYEHRPDIFVQRVLFPRDPELADATLDPKQTEILIATQSEILLLWSRQTGKTRTAGFLVSHGAVYNMPMQLIVSGGERQAQIVQDRVTQHMRTLGRDERWEEVPETEAPAAFVPKDIFADHIKIVRCSAKFLQLGNGHRVVSAPASPTTIRGFSPNRIILDESAYVPDSVYEAVRPMRARTKAQLICMSSAGAQMGWFYEWWCEDDPGCFKSEYLADECEGIGEGYLERERQRLSPGIYRREYENEFQPVAGGLFTAEQLEGMFVQDGEEAPQPWLPPLEAMLRPEGPNGHE